MLPTSATVRLLAVGKHHPRAGGYRTDLAASGSEAGWNSAQRGSKNRGERYSERKMSDMLNC